MSMLAAFRRPVPLLGVVGDRTGSADPDRVRAAVDEQRTDLRERSAEVDTTEDFRAGLAWADHALDAIAAAANDADAVRGVDLPPIFLMYAFRYDGLGRMSYAVGDVADALIAHRGRLQTDWRAQIVRDIDDAIRGQRLTGMPQDVARWLDVREAMQP